ncbi:SNF1-related protein kinase regulatory subunit gamma-1-like [Abeliophyllum distichum]|uniref:SNF1-related protein kinase regulatory subunit gamma-1-like n=1 Tax=Abeliophyllum distichum TaxID=126358 RepID=A0ABD1U324_9LAMI
MVLRPDGGRGESPIWSQNQWGEIPSDVVKPRGRVSPRNQGGPLVSIHQMGDSPLVAATPEGRNPPDHSNKIAERAIDSVVDMAQVQEANKSANYDAYFDMAQCRKKLPLSLQETLTNAFAKIPVSSFPQVPGGKVIEILADTSIGDAVKILSEFNILSAPVINPDHRNSNDWRERYLGIIDYSAIVLWVLQNAEMAAAALSASLAAAAGVSAGAAGAIGALALGATGPVAIAGLTVAAVGAAVAGGAAADKGIGRDAPTAANKLGEDFYKIILREEPSKSTMVRSILKSYRWAPLIPVGIDSSMLSVMLLLSKYRLRNVPVIETGSPSIKNFITQSAVVQGLKGCKGRDWFDCISAHPLSELGLPFSSPDEVVSAQGNELVLEAFKKMKDNQIGGLPIVEGPKKKIIGNLSIRDIRFLLLKPELFASFRELTVKDFMYTVASATNDSGRIITPITCKPESTLSTVIDTLAIKSVHRIYVVGEENDVVGVITLRDVISCFITEPPNFFDNYFGFAAQEMLIP